MNKKLAQEHLEKLISEGKFQSVDSIMNFLMACHPLGEVEELLAMAVKKKEIYLKEKEEAEKREKAEYLRTHNLVMNARFSWDEMMEILEDVGGVITFAPVGKTTLFSRYGEDRDGHLITTFGLSHYQPLRHIKEEKLEPYKAYTYSVESFYSKWNDGKIAKYLEEREAVAEKV